VKAINDDSGKLYIFGGGANKFVGSPTKCWFNDMVIFNTVESSWIISTYPRSDFHIPQHYYQMVLLHTLEDMN